jgi:hypothetical protein
MKRLITSLSLAAAIVLGFVNTLAVEPPGIFVFTDRVVYARPAQVTVFGVVLDAEGNPVSNIALKIEVTDPNGDTVFNAEVTTGPDGKFSASFSLSSEAPEGQYTVSVQDLTGAYWTADTSFQVCDICVITTMQTNNYITVTRTATYTSEITRTQTVYFTTTTSTTITTQATTTVTSYETITMTMTTERAMYITMVKTTQVTTSIKETKTVTILNEKTKTIITTITTKITTTPSYTTRILLYMIIIAALTIIAVLSLTSYYAIKHFRTSNY